MTDKKLLLLIETNLKDAQFIQKVLAQSQSALYERFHANNIVTALEYLTNSLPDIILLSSACIDHSKPSIFQKIYELNSTVALIVLTEDDNINLQQSLSSSTAQDYLVKSKINSYILHRSIIHSINNKKLSLELSHKNNVLKPNIEHNNFNLVQQNNHLKNLISQLNTDLDLKNQEIQQFTFSAAHDLQEPIRKISGFTKRLLKKNENHLDQKSIEYFRIITDAASRMNKLIHRLLKLSKLDLNRKNFKIVDMNKVVDLAQSNLRSLIKESNSQIEVETLPSIVGDQNQLVQLVQNLIENGIKYNTNSVPTVKISSKKTNASTAFYVEDNGIGIDEKFFEKIFGIFQRLHSRHEYEGTGFGLYLCKRIIETHKGKINVQSNPNKTLFTFTIGL